MTTIANDNTPKLAIADLSPLFAEMTPPWHRVETVGGFPIVTDRAGAAPYHEKLSYLTRAFLDSLPDCAFDADFMVNHEVFRPSGKLWFGSFMACRVALRQLHVFPYAEKSPAWQRIKYKSSNDAGWDMLQFLKTGVIAA